MAEQNDAAGVIAPAREKRMSLSNVAPSAVNGWTGSVTATIAETREKIVFNFKTPELSERDSRAIAAGYASRLSIAASGKKTAADIAKALQDEILTLTAGTYTIRGGNSVQSSFSDTIISLALLRKFSEVDTVKCNFSHEQYEEILADQATLLAVQADWDVADEADRKALITGSVAKTKRLVGFFKM
ncbi:MAG: hypothetical protein EPN17_01405 [Methylobacter sp.]|nr:MAG: hypothetical protein EPN17_01405 [Methylobacter sp.]